MRIHTLWLKAALLLSVVNLPAYGMFKKPKNPFEQEIQHYKKQSAPQKQQLKPKPAEKTSQAPRLTRRSFNDLPEHIQIQIADYLNYDDQFRLAQTNRQQLFLWGSLTRVPEPVPVITTTQEVTRFNWDDQVWPTMVHPTVIIQLDRSIGEDEDLFDLQRLGISGLNGIRHLHFDAESHTQRELSINVDRLMQRNAFSENFNNLQSLVFNWIVPVWYIEGIGLPHLQSFVVNGSLESQRNRSPKHTFSFVSLLRFRPDLRNISLNRSQLSKLALQRLYQLIRDYSGGSHTEIRLTILDNGLRREERGHDVGSQRVFPLMLRPLVAHQGNLLIVLNGGRLMQGPSSLERLRLLVNNQPTEQSWANIFSILSHHLPFSSLLPALSTRSRIERLHRLRVQIPDLKLVQVDRKKAISLPKAIEKSFQ